MPSPPESESLLQTVAGRFTAWAERWIPDAFVFALVATIIVVALAMSMTDTGPPDVVRIWGRGLWGLLSFTMQMALVVITGYVVATAPKVHSLIAALAKAPRSPRSAVAMVALFAMATSWLNWGFSLMFSAMLAKETARRIPGVDYRALAAASFLGLGSVWAQGLSGSAALQMATPTALPQGIRTIVEHGGVIEGGVIPLTSTIFLWQSLVSVAVELVLLTVLMYFVAPTAARAKSAQALGIDLGPSPSEGSAEPPTKPKTPVEWLEHTPVLNLVIGALAVTYIVSHFASASSALHAISLDVINLSFLTLGVLLHWTPARLMRAVREATPAVWGIILQFPFYAGMAAIISETKLNELVARWFVSISTRETFPAVIAGYSAVLGVFVPSGGGKWVIEAPYVMAAAHDHQVHLGWMVAVYDLGEALANLVQPFWMLPILAVFALKARDIMGYTFLVFLVLTPVVLVLVTILGATLRYPL